MLLPVVVLLNRAETKPMSFLFLIRDVNLVKNVPLAGSPQNLAQEIQQGLGDAFVERFKDAEPPPALGPVWINLEED